jgi:hypothetical protein
VKTKHFIIVLVVLALLAVGSFIYIRSRAPYISLENIDYLNKKIKFVMSAGGKKFAAEKSFSDKADMDFHNGIYDFEVETTPEGFYMKIFKESKFLRGLKIDLTNRTVIVTNHE